MKIISANACPVCGDYPIHYSRKGGPFKSLVSAFGYAYYRCWRCGMRFLGRKGIDGARPAGHRHHHKKSASSGSHQ